jgi:hypothetical protein
VVRRSSFLGRGAGRFGAPPVLGVARATLGSAAPVALVTIIALVLEAGKRWL